MNRIFALLFALVAVHEPLVAAAAEERAAAASSSVAAVEMRSAAVEQVSAPAFTYRVECVGDCGGTGGWVEEVHNLVVTGGKNDAIDCYFKATTCPAAWYMGLKGTGSVAAGDTLASHAGWTEVTPYSGNRPAITFGTTSAGSNTATAVSYSITGSATVAGAFVADVNTGTAGVLYSASDFSASRSVVNGDTLNVTLTVSF